MATKQELREQFIQGLIDIVVQNHPIDLSNFRRNVDDSGQLTTSSTELNDDLVIYNENYQTYFEGDFNTKIDTLIDNYEITANPGTYYEVNSNNWEYAPVVSPTSEFRCYDETGEFTDTACNGEDDESTCNTLGTGYYCGVYTTQSQLAQITVIQNTVVGDVVFEVNDNLLTILSQLVGFNTTVNSIDTSNAQEILDTNIFELVPQSTTKQQEINEFFDAYSRLKGDKPGEGGLPSFVDLDGNGTLDGFQNASQAEQYRTSHDISSANNDGSIIRLRNNATSDNPASNTLQGLRDDLNQFLVDVDSETFLSEEDERPIYQHKSPGHLQIRQLNQFIIIRNKEDDDIGILGNEDDGYGKSNPKFLTDGFTITMWVKFLDKVSDGTLFNFGNSTRDENPFGFKLETFVVKEEDVDNTLPTGAADDATTYLEDVKAAGFFSNGSNERFLRLVVRDSNGVRDSHFGSSLNDRLKTATGSETTNLSAKEYDINYSFNYTNIPIDVNEWYFIVANFAPSTYVNEDDSFTAGLLGDEDYWRWNKLADGTFTNFSGAGAQCKVEFISKSDLIRARGFRSE